MDEQFTIERYSHVMHIVSNVKGILKKGLDCFDVLAAAFPAGTLSGAPKIRAMEIIDELEPTRRGLYGGAIGYISFSGNMDTAIAIRTLLIKDKTAYLGVGAGIVADSVPQSEFEESMNKGRALLKAIELAGKGVGSMILMVDNYDSFTYNLVQYMGELGAEIRVERNDQISLQEIEVLKPHKIVISPGPCTPDKAGISGGCYQIFCRENSDSGSLFGASVRGPGVRR